MDFERHLKVVNACMTEGDLHNNWFSIIANEFFDAANKEIQHEKRGPKGIVDVAILKNHRCQIAIELKKPKKEYLGLSFEQAHRYSSCFLNPRDGLTVFPLGVLTDGKTAIIFDSSLEIEQADASKETLDLTIKSGFDTFINIFKLVSRGKLSHKLHRQPIKDTRPIGLLDERMKKKCKETLDFLKLNIQNDSLAFDYWVQLFLVAILRDHGIIPNIVLKEYQNKNNVEGITVEINRILNENFKPLNKKYAESIWYVYGKYGLFPTRLNLLNADTLGFAYESILHEFSKQLHKTSVYTPEDLAIEMISKLSPCRNDIMIDIAAGTGTLLCIATEMAWKDFDYENEDISVLSKFFENNIVAIDRDSYALKCCKAMLLGSYVKILNIEPVDLGNTWILPKINGIENDLFKTKIDKKVSLLVGNPPWGNIDGPNNPTGISSEIRAFIKNIKTGHGDIYSDDSDIATYVVKHCLEERIFKKGKNFRCGLLIKQQILTTKSNKDFMTWAKNQDIFFIDHGAEKRFKHSQASLVAECLVGIANKHKKEQKIIEQNNLSDFLYMTAGFQPSKKDVYIQIAKQNIDHVNNYLLYPDKSNSQHIIWKQEASDTIFFVKNGTEFPKDTIITNEQKAQLKQRAQVAQNYPLSWRGTEKIEHYGENLETPRLFMPRMPAKNERVKCGIDLLGEGIGTSGQSIWIKKPSCSLEQLICICAWVNSSYFEQALIDCHVTLRAHGYELSSGEASKIKVPKHIFSDDILNLAKKIIKNRFASEKDLQLLDALC